jgi:hypothetical protein
MSYFKGGLIESIDYNNIVDAASGLNYVLGTGSGIVGYGQTPILPIVSTDATINASNWANLYDRIRTIATYQDTAFPNSYARPTAGNIVNYVNQLGSPALPGSLILSLINNMGNAKDSGNEQLYAINPFTRRQYYFYVEFPTGDNTRYFFNAGGLIFFKFEQSGSGTVNDLIKNITKNTGEVYLNSTNVETKKIDGSLYNGVTRKKGEGPNPTINSLGYYQLTTSYTEIFRQTSTSALSPNDYLSIQAKTNGPQGFNSDNGRKIEFLITFGMIPAGQTVPGGNTKIDFTLVYPSTSGIAPTWGVGYQDGGPVL